MDAISGDQNLESKSVDSERSERSTFAGGTNSNNDHLYWLAEGSRSRSSSSSSSKRRRRINAVHVQFEGEQSSVSAVSPAMIREAFAPWGPILGVSVSDSNFNRGSTGHLELARCSGFVSFPPTRDGENAAKAAAQALDWVTISDMRMHCNMVDAAEDTVVGDNSGRGRYRDHEIDSGHSRFTRKNTVHVQFEGEQISVSTVTQAMIKEAFAPWGPILGVSISDSKFNRVSVGPHQLPRCSGFVNFPPTPVGERMAKAAAQALDGETISGMRMYCLIVDTGDAAAGASSDRSCDHGTTNSSTSSSTSAHGRRENLIPLSSVLSSFEESDIITPGQPRHARDSLLASDTTQRFDIRSPPLIRDRLNHLAPVPVGAPTIKTWHVKRKPVLAETVERLCSGMKTPRVVALVGGSGSGKTTVASEIVRSARVRNFFSGGIVWLRVGVNAQTRLPSLMQHLADRMAEHGFGGTLAGGMPMASEDPTSYIKRRVRDGQGRQVGLRYLVVADDVRESEVVAKLVQTGLWVLLTTRNSSVGNKSLVGGVRGGTITTVEMVKVGGMSKEEADVLLRRSAEVPLNAELPDAAQEVAELCYRTAMDMSFVGRWIALRGRADRLAWLDAVSSIQSQLRGGARANPAAILDGEESAASMRRRRAIIRAGFDDFGVVMGDHRINSLYVALAVMPDGYAFTLRNASVLLFDRACSSAEDLAQAEHVLQILERWSILSVTEGNKYSICDDAQVKSFAKETLRDRGDIRRSALRRWVRFISSLEAVRDIDGSVLKRLWSAAERAGGEGWEETRPYERALAGMDESDSMYRESLEAVASFQGIQGDWPAARATWRRLLTIEEEHFLKAADHPSFMVRTLGKLSECADRMGKPSEAQWLRQRERETVLLVLSRASTRNVEAWDLDVVSASALEALALATFRCFPKEAGLLAERLLRRASVIAAEAAKCVGGNAIAECSRHRAQLASILHELGAHLLRRTGGHGEAESVLRRALRIRKIELGKDHDQVASTLQVLRACVYQAGRHQEQADGALQRALEIEEANPPPSDGASMGNAVSQEVCHINLREMERIDDAESFSLHLWLGQDLDVPATAGQHQVGDMSDDAFKAGIVSIPQRGADSKRAAAEGYFSARASSPRPRRGHAAGGWANKMELAGRLTSQPTEISLLPNAGVRLIVGPGCLRQGQSAGPISVLTGATHLVECGTDRFLVSLVVDCQPSGSEFEVPLEFDFRVSGPPIVDRGADGDCDLDSQAWVDLAEEQHEEYMESIRDTYKVLIRDREGEEWDLLGEEKTRVIFERGMFFVRASIDHFSQSCLARIVKTDAAWDEHVVTWPTNRPGEREIEFVNATDRPLVFLVLPTTWSNRAIREVATGVAVEGCEAKFAVSRASEQGFLEEATDPQVFQVPRRCLEGVPRAGEVCPFETCSLPERTGSQAKVALITIDDTAVAVWYYRIVNHKTRVAVLPGQFSNGMVPTLGRHDRRELTQDCLLNIALMALVRGLQWPGPLA